MIKNPPKAEIFFRNVAGTAVTSDYDEICMSRVFRMIHHDSVNIFVCRKYFCSMCVVWRSDFLKSQSEKSEKITCLTDVIRKLESLESVVI